MAKTLALVRGEVLRRLNDDAQVFWTTSEVDRYVGQAYREVARLTRCLWDMRYAENLPAGFSYTARWEQPYLATLLEAGFDYGCANYTLDDERRLLTETERIGPANHTSPFEATDLWLNGTSGCGASDAIPATAVLPDTVHTIDRSTWDDKAIGVLRPIEAARLDSRFQLTEGEVEALVTKEDGLQTIRKVRVPAAQADTYQVTRSWGLLRRPTDISGATVSGTWGVPRQLPGMHPMGPERWGIPRRPYRDGKNVRIEHWREGRDVSAPADEFEVPDRVVVYIRDYAISRCLGRSGPAQDLRLAAHYDQRYRRGVARLERRLQAQSRMRVGQMGGGGASGVRRAPPRPKLPWQFGQELR